MIMFNFNSVKNDIQNDADTLLKIPVGFYVRFPLLPSPSVNTVRTCFECLEELCFQVGLGGSTEWKLRGGW